MKVAMNSASASRARGDKRTLGGMAGEKNQITETCLPLVISHVAHTKHERIVSCFTN